MLVHTYVQNWQFHVKTLYLFAIQFHLRPHHNTQKYNIDQFYVNFVNSGQSETGYVYLLQINYVCMYIRTVIEHRHCTK